MRQHTWGLAIRTFAVAAMLVVTGLSAPAAFAEKYASIVIDTETHEVLHARNADAPPLSSVPDEGHDALHAV